MRERGVTERTQNFVVFADDWGRHLSSVQHIFRRILARGHRVLWVNTIGLRSARADGFTFRRGVEKLRSWARPLRVLSGSFRVLSPRMLPVVGRSWLGRWNAANTAAVIRRAIGQMGMTRPVMLSTVPTAADYVGRLGESLVVYYITDDFSLWPGGDAEAIRRQDRELTAAADVLFPCNATLDASHRTPHARSVLLPHAVDLEHFAADASPEPADLAGVPHPRACFFGLVYEKIDLPAVAAAARAAPEVQFVLIGPVQTDTAATAGVANVRYLGARPYEQLPAYLSHMDALMIPYVLDDETLNKGPLKIRECLAVGLPTVARAIPDLQPLADLVTLYNDPAELAGYVRAALATADCDSLRDAMRRRVDGETWDARAATVLATLEEVL